MLSSSNLLKSSLTEDTQEKDRLRKLKQKFHFDRSAKDLSDLQRNDLVQMQPFTLNEKKWKKAAVVKPLEKRSFVVESAGQLYIRKRRHLKRSAEADSPLAKEKPPSLVSDDQPTLELMAKTSINQPLVYHCGEQGPGTYREQ